MLRALLSLLATLAFLTSTAAGAAPREIDWEDLLPDTVRQIHEEADEINRHLTGLPPAEREAYDKVQDELDLRARIERGFIKEADLGERSRALLADPPSRRHPEALAFWQRVQALSDTLRAESAKPNAGLGGQRIRLPGYVLPLEFDGENVKEFLLVPYVGACIHSPPPPGNQIVFVKADKAFKSEGLFQPVWVEGVINPERASHRLSLVDGSGDVEAGYAMSASRIEEFRRN